MAIDRSKIKGTKLTTISNQREKVEALLPYKRDWTDYHKMKDSGMYIMRIAPAHNSAEHSAYEIKKEAWLEIQVSIFDANGKETGEIEKKNVNIFTSTAHGGPKVDPIELYIQKVRQMVMDTVEGKTERDERLRPLMGGQTGKGYIYGIAPSPKYVCYAWKVEGENRTLGLLSLNNTIVKAIERLNIDEDTNQPMEVDKFSDPDNGVSLVINYDKTKAGSDKYATSARMPKHMSEVGFKEFAAGELVTDEMLEELFEKKSLYDMFINVYSQKDFDMAIEGLRRFDDINGYGAFENEEFIEQLHNIQAELKEILIARGDGEEEKPASEDISKEESTAPPEPEKAKVTRGRPKGARVNKTPEVAPVAVPVAVPVESSTISEFASMNVRKLKAYLNVFIEEQYDNEYELPVALDKPTLVKWCELAKDDKDLPFTDADLVVPAGIVTNSPPPDKKPEDVVVPGQQDEGNLDKQIDNILNSGT